MKICVTSTGRSMDSHIDPAFEKAFYYLIVDTERMVVEEVLENKDADKVQGTGLSAANMIIQKGIDAVLTGFIIGNAFDILQNSDIRVYQGAKETENVKDAVEKFNRNEYKVAMQPTEGPEAPRGFGRGRGKGQRKGKGPHGGGRWS